MGRVEKLLGVQFDRSNDKICLHQKKAILKLAAEFGISENQLVKVPISVGTTLNKCADYEKDDDFQYRSYENIKIYTDASWATDLESCRSFGGFILYLRNSVVTWGCKKQSTVATSIMEAEYMALRTPKRNILELNTVLYENSS
uniref:Uncharacterized protein n=1 Tax=Strigamia maritima TaxID=126957 RepID=T1J0W7_STRMM